MIEKLEQLTPEEYQIVRKFFNSLEPTDFIEMVGLTTGWYIGIEKGKEEVEGIIFGTEEWIEETVTDIGDFEIMMPPENDWMVESETQEDLPDFNNNKRPN